MGKDSKHQRTKGGVQPSSASRTAELLEKAGASAQPLTFLAAAAELRQEFSAFSNAVLPTINSGSPVHNSILANVLIDDDLPPEVRLIFRKLQKKDATTKIKALAELSQLLDSTSTNEKDESSSGGDDGSGDTKTEDPQELSKIILPQWSKCFPKLTVDDSRKVRELTQSTHANICKTVGRNLAPYLKQLMPHWYLAQFDIYGVAASAAKKSLRKAAAPQKDKKKGGNKKKGQGQGDEEQPAAEVEQVKELPSSQTSGDSESYEIRTTFATLQGISNLLQQQLANEELLEFVFGSDGVFWDGAEATKDILIRRCCFDLLSTFVASTAQVENAPVVSIPAGRCTKLMNSALSATQKEILPSVWNTFLTLTLKGILKDAQLAQRQLLTCCRNGFYSNASQIGPSVLPLLARIWDGIPDDDKKSEFATDLTKSFIKGYEAERSNYEKAAILRTFAETIGFLMKNGVCDIDATHLFILDNLKTIHNEFPKLLGALVKDTSFFKTLTEKAIGANVMNTKEFGDFMVGLVQKPTSLFTDAQPIRRRVKFRDEENSEPDDATLQPFEVLPEHKQQFLQDFVQTCTSTHSYVALSIVSRQFRHVNLWSSVNVSEIDLSQEEEKRIRLRISLDLIALHPDNPQILGIFSDQFEFFKEPSDLVVFLEELNSFSHLPPIKKWIRMAIFTVVIETSLKTAALSEAELLTVLKFVLKDIFSDDFIANICAILVERMDRDKTFFENLARIMSYSKFKVDVSTVYGKFWEVLLLKTVEAAEGSSLELSESVCTKNNGVLSKMVLMEKLERQLELCRTVKQIDSLVEVCRKMHIRDDDIELAIKTPSLNIKPELLLFCGYGYSCTINDALEPVPKFGSPHLSIILKSILHGKFVQDSEEQEELIMPLINVLYAQSIARVWSEIEKSEYFDHLSDDLTQELGVISSRLIERVYSDSRPRLQFIAKMNQAIQSQDPIWASRLPTRILSEYCEKADIPYGITPAKQKEDFTHQVDNILYNFQMNNFDIKETVAWMTERRNQHADDFEFETLFMHTKNKGLMSKLLLITLELLDRVEPEHEEFLSTGTCWIEAWLKHTKNLEITSKLHLVWINNLARAVRIIGDRARALDNVCPKFLQEYLEFHCAQIYPIIYALYLQLNELSSHSFWTMQALYNVSRALATMPGTTLAFIEPDAVKICDTFSNILGHGVNLPTRVAAYRVLRKVKYDTGEAKDLPIIPPGIDDVIKTLMVKLKTSENVELDRHRQSYEEERKYLVSYLLIWDALLKIQQSSNEFASYVRDQDHLLKPFLDTLFFSESIPLENATSKCFDTDPVLVPGTKINLLHLSCSVLQRALRNLPYTVRWWWNNHVTKQRDRVFVEKYVVKHLSSKLASEELGGVKLREGIDDNVTVQCHSGCNELVAHYKIEETNVTLTISLPLNHPLGPVTVKISDKKLHAKVSQLLNTRSHSLSAGLKLWKENLDGLYKDVDECAICFFILHHVTKQTPKLACKTCRKKVLDVKQVGVPVV
ncbi:E3 ubiquitin-protein ligase listerin [Orchesella cincta]|uniref:E3 ubiquitin-protein ligase listerin n=1 Tax=Orchesella cincta TaxID=48709 RepID=A0A1D2MZY6_ORCCI|nr:E3 ubiquitin-protein ligase listerin [Orchesella cincta]